MTRSLLLALGALVSTGVALAAKPQEKFRMIEVSDLERMQKSSKSAPTLLDANDAEFRERNGVIPGAKLLSSFDQYDPANEVGQEFLDRYEKRFGRRPEYCVPVVNRDLATVLLKAFADARPLSPAGVRDALERVKMFPAASGAPGTRISFGRYMHRGWMGPGYLVARQLDPDGKTAHLVDRFGQT